ncbi:MAG TPA: Fic family protein [Acidimicrobiia bacterium]|nr:Fic family protein [Acidimicrobiia bacterium]
MKRPGLRLAIEINERVRSDDEWFDEPDELDRVEAAIQSIDDFDDPIAAAGAIAFRVTRAQGFTEGNKRTALLLAWHQPESRRDAIMSAPPRRGLADR